LISKARFLIYFKIFTVLFVGVLGLTISIYNLKLNNEQKIYELLATKTQQIKEKREYSIEKYLAPILFFQENTGVPFSRSILLDWLSSNDLEYQKINKTFHDNIKKFKSNINSKFENINFITWLSSVTIIILFFWYLFIQMKILKKFKKYKYNIEKGNI